ncbi:hypothetical protein [Peribacillus sp. R9-11]|uniref:hypothetical protein n=1 Tax=Peribacillus sp. R9-11 TaxID=3073271 RepID=UPI002869315B|nr:hypothetical protein [Peribacillus sp. R9-11]WMX57674.1 hypothetical protein RE409_10925 [Peribacillus sp. R9-11]
MTNFQPELSTQCRKSYESISAIIEQKIKKELETVFYALLLKRNLPKEKEALRIGAVMLSWGIYGASNFTVMTNSLLLINLNPNIKIAQIKLAIL